VSASEDAYPDRDTYQALYRRYLGDGARPVAALLDLAGDLRGKDVLDLCGGAGTLAVEAAARNAASVLMVDAAERMVDLGAMKRAGVQVEIASLEGWLSKARPGAFDAAFCRQAVNYWLTPGTAALLAACMRPGGVFVFNTFSRKPPEEPGKGVKSYALEGHHFVEVSWLCPDGRVQHVQCRDGLPPHTTSFRWISQAGFRSLLEPHFEVDVRLDGGTALYLCRRA
jgi:ubiquinone/menaquinone biosynthesis C-methylase UbiE